MKSLSFKKGGKMNKVSIVALIILGIVVTGCTQTDDIQVEPDLKEITTKDQAEVKEMMQVIFVNQDIDKALENSFKDLETLRKIQVALETDTLEETKEILITKYKRLPVFETRPEILDKFQPASINIYQEDDHIAATIDVDINGDLQTTKYVFLQNEKGEWYNTEDLTGLARELKIKIED